MQIDCSTLTAAGRQYAIDHNLNICGVLGTNTAGVNAKTDSLAVTPLNTGSSTGNCGVATIQIWSLGAGRAYIQWALHSTTGLIIYYSVGTPYWGQTHSGTFSYSGAFPGNDVAGGNPATTGSGYAHTYLSGSVSTVLYDCVVLNPSAWTTV